MWDCFITAHQLRLLVVYELSLLCVIMRIYANIPSLGRFNINKPIPVKLRIQVTILHVHARRLNESQKCRYTYEGSERNAEDQIVRVSFSFYDMCVVESFCMCPGDVLHVKGIFNYAFADTQLRTSLLVISLTGSFPDSSTSLAPSSKEQTCAYWARVWYSILNMIGICPPLRFSNTFPPL